VCSPEPCPFKRLHVEWCEKIALWSSSGVWSLDSGHYLFEIGALGRNPSHGLNVYNAFNEAEDTSDTTSIIDMYIYSFLLSRTKRILLLSFSVNFTVGLLSFDSINKTTPTGVDLYLRRRTNPSFFDKALSSTACRAGTTAQSISRSKITTDINLSDYTQTKLT
jgi:hypothetical protein